MKKLKKCDFKKLALMGMAGGVMLASQANATQIADSEDYSKLLAAGCQGRMGCSGNSGNSYIGGQSQNVSYNAPSHSCQANSMSYNAPSHSCQANSTSYNAPSHSCQANSMSYNTPSNSCQGVTPAKPAGSTYYTDAQGQWQQGTPPQNYTNPQGPAPGPVPGTQGMGQPGQMGQPQSMPQAFNSNNNRGQWQSRYTADAATNSGKLTESQLLSQLNDQARAVYQNMDAQGKALALKLANQSCKGQNDCKNLNSCKTDENSCAGKGSCAGKSKGPFQDKNLAVKVAAMKMAEKRSGATSPR